MVIPLERAGSSTPLERNRNVRTSFPTNPQQARFSRNGGTTSAQSHSNRIVPARLPRRTVPQNHHRSHSAFPRRPVNDNRNLNGYNSRMQNVSNDDSFLELENITVNNPDEFMENRQIIQTEFIIQNNPEYMTTEDTVIDQSTWIADSACYFMSPQNEPSVDHFDVHEPILASSFGSNGLVETPNKAESAQNIERGRSTLAKQVSDTQGPIARAKSQAAGTVSRASILPPTARGTRRVPQARATTNTANSSIGSQDPRTLVAPIDPAVQILNQQPIDPGHSNNLPAVQPRPSQQTIVDSRPSVLQAIDDLPNISMHEDSIEESIESIANGLQQQNLENNQNSQNNARNENTVEIFQNVRQLNSVTSEDIAKMSTEDAQNHGIQMWYSLPHVRYRSAYPFVASGVIQKDHELPGLLRVYSSRMGKIHIPDHASRKTADDYVYFLALGPERYAGFLFLTHENNMISTKFPSANVIEIKVYAIMAHPIGGAGTRTQGHWVCWSDQLGMMRVREGSARTAVKKDPNWKKQLDIVSVQALFESGRFVVKNLVALTNTVEKKRHFPNEVFLIRDAKLRNLERDDYVFHSHSLNLHVSLSKTLCGDLEIDSNHHYQIVAAPTFNGSTKLVFRALSVITDHRSLFDGDRQWIFQNLLSNTEEYEKDAFFRKSNSS